MSYWEWLGRFDTILSILTVIFSGYAAFRLWQQDRRLRELAKVRQGSAPVQEQIDLYRGIQTVSPVALAVSLLPNLPSISQDVERFLNTNGWNMPVEELNMSGLNGRSDLEQFVKLLEEKKRYLNLQGFTELHLFIAGPVQAGTIIGALYDNWIPVKLYHKPTPSPAGTYEYWMPLRGS